MDKITLTKALEIDREISSLKYKITECNETISRVSITPDYNDDGFVNLNGWENSPLIMRRNAVMQEIEAYKVSLQKRIEEKEKQFSEL